MEKHEESLSAFGRGCFCPYFFDRILVVYVM